MRIAEQPEPTPVRPHPAPPGSARNAHRPRVRSPWASGHRKADDHQAAKLARAVSAASGDRSGQPWTGRGETPRVLDTAGWTPGFPLRPQAPDEVTHVPDNVSRPDTNRGSTARPLHCHPHPTLRKQNTQLEAAPSLPHLPQAFFYPQALENGNCQRCHDTGILFGKQVITLR